MSSTRPESRYVIHVGVHPRELRHVLHALTGITEMAHVDGDGWNTWSEPVGTDANDDITLHVASVISGEHTSVEKTATRLVNQLDHQGVLATSSEGRSTVAVLTSEADYNVDDGGGLVWERIEGVLTRRTVTPPAPAPRQSHNEYSVLAHALQHAETQGPTGPNL